MFDNKVAVITGGANGIGKCQWNEELRAKGYTTVGGRVSRRFYQEKIYGAGEE